MNVQSFVLSNDVKVPKLAFGTHQLPKGHAGYDVITNALNAGYRHIDSTYGYGNEQLIMQALRAQQLKREDVFITSKLWNADQGYESTLAAFENVCNQLETDYLDLFLIRWPIPIDHVDDYQALNQATWKAFEQLYAEKRVRAIGVCNFLIHHLVPLMESVTIKPMVNQIEFNPFYQQREIVSYCQERDILIESWTPIQLTALSHSELAQMARKYATSIDQLCLAYCLTKNILPITYTQVKEQMQHNTDIFDLKLTVEDIAYLDSLNTLTEYTFHPDRHEEWFA